VQCYVEVGLSQKKPSIEIFSKVNGMTPKKVLLKLQIWFFLDLSWIIFKRYGYTDQHSNLFARPDGDARH
jgi:hypothetical protein